MKIAIIGAGWAGLAAGVRAVQAGHRVEVFEAAPMPGGRARSDDDGVEAIDNGQHILLGGYARTLALMRDVGVDTAAALARSPLAVTYPDGAGFALSPHGPRMLAAARALLGARGFDWRDKGAALATAAAWRARGFRCDAALTVEALLAGTTTARLRRRLFEPLCVSALNTPPAAASAAVFLAVMRDSVFGAREASDLLLPRRPLAQLLPLPALAWLRTRGATVHLRRRVLSLRREDAAWALDVGEDGAPSARFDRIVLATPATEAARLALPLAPAWATPAAALAHEPIVTVLLHAAPRAWPAPMLALDSDATHRPAQFAFRVGAPRPDADRVALVTSAAGDWLTRGLDTIASAACAQYRHALRLGPREPVDCLDARTDRRATFRCVAGVVRPPTRVADGVFAAGDYIDGPYPATLEAAVLAGEAAAAALDR